MFHAEKTKMAASVRRRMKGNTNNGDEGRSVVTRSSCCSVKVTTANNAADGDNHTTLKLITTCQSSIGDRCNNSPNPNDAYNYQYYYKDSGCHKTISTDDVVRTEKIHNHSRRHNKPSPLWRWPNSHHLLAIVTFLIVFVLNNHLGQAFVLDGSQSSFAQFRKWYSGLNGSMELELKTEQPNGLVLYTDDGGTYDFFEVKLVEGALRLRYNLGGGAQIITVGRDLHDGHWHKVQVSASSPECKAISSICL